MSHRQAADDQCRPQGGAAGGAMAMKPSRHCRLRGHCRRMHSRVTAAARQRGMVLVAALWVLLLLSMLAVSYSLTARTSVALARNVVGEAEAEALADAGHHDPASMVPFPTMHELFSIGWGEPDLREQWKDATPEARAELLKETSSRPYEPDPLRTHTPASAYGAEWYGSAEDICRVHAALQQGAVGPAAPVRDIMSEIPGIDLDRARWPYIGAKAGNLPGELTFSWYAVDRTGQPWVVSLQTNWPRFHGPQTGGWLMSIIKQMFALIPMGGD